MVVLPTWRGPDMTCMSRLGWSARPAGCRRRGGARRVSAHCLSYWENLLGWSWLPCFRSEVNRVAFRGVLVVDPFGAVGPVMSLNLHSAALGTRVVGVSAVMRLISPARRSVNFWSTAAAGTSTV